MYEDYTRVTALDEDAHKSAAAKRLKREIFWVDKAVLRLLWLVWESFKYNADTCVLGMRLLRGLVLVLPDSRLVEEIHMFLRDLARHNKNNINSFAPKYAAAMHSNKLEERGVPHFKVTKEEFVGKFREKAARKPMPSKYAAKRFKMPQLMSSMMGHKNWESPTQESYCNSLGAWFWNTYRVDNGIADHDAAWWTKLMKPHTLLLYVPDQHFSVCLGTLKRAALGFSAVHLGNSANTNIFTVRPQELEILHMTQPLMWHQIPWEPVAPSVAARDLPLFSNCGLVFRQTGPAEPFLKSVFRHKQTLTLAQLHLVADVLGVAPLERTRIGVVRQICDKLCEGDTPEATDTYTTNATNNDTPSQERKQPKPKHDLATCTLTRLTFDEFDEDNRAEFQDFKHRCDRHDKDIQVAQLVRQIKRARAKVPRPSLVSVCTSYVSRVAR